jgi:tetratricopeptide (TPR) repeat protein
VLIDGRLELPSRPSFDRFVRLSDKIREGRPGWSDLLRGMGDPLILLDHEEDVGAEATLMAQPGWRCLYFDAIASVFVAQRDDGRDAAIPTLDFAARHFHDAAWRSVPPLPAGLGEARALVKLGTAVRRRPGFSWPRRMALMLTAADRLRQGLNAQLDAAPRATLWAMLGHTTWNMAPDFSRPPLGVDESWELAAGIPLAQASFCYQQALELDPREQSALISLHDSYKARRMYDAQEAMATRIRALASPSAQRVSWPAEAKSQSNLEPPSAGDISTAILATIDQGRPLEAITMFDAAEKRGLTLPWGPRDQLAAALVQLGRPQVARHVWESAKDAPSAAILDARRGDTFLAELDFPSAQRAYQRAVESDSQLADAWIGLAYLHTQSGDAAEAIAAVRAGLALPAISTRGKALLEGLLELIEPLDSMR